MNEIQQLKAAIELRGDFITWLFEESGEIEHISYNEAYEKWQESISEIDG